MGLKFFGGPYDGMDIDHALVDAFAKHKDVRGDVGDRGFVQLPDSREVWERLIRGESVAAENLVTYEWLNTPTGPYLVAMPPGTLEKAESEARLIVHPRAQPGLATLNNEDRRRVIEAADALQHQYSERWPREKVLRIREDLPEYLLYATPQYRAIIRPGGDHRVELLDIVHKDTLQLFARKDREAGAPL